VNKVSYYTFNCSRGGGGSPEYVKKGPRKTAESKNFSSHDMIYTGSVQGEG